MVMAASLVLGCRLWESGVVVGCWKVGWSLVIGCWTSYMLKGFGF